MKTLKILCVIIIFPFFVSCFNKEYEQNKEKLNDASTISDLVYLAYNLRNDTLFPEICQLLNDSIISTDSFYWLEIMTEINTTTEEVKWGFDKIEASTFPRVSERYLFEICIKDENTILIEHEIGDVSSIQELAKEYIFDPDGKDKHLEKLKDSVEFFGEVEISKVGGFLTSNVKAKAGLSIEEWRLYFKCLHELMLVFENMKNEIAMKKWNIDYNSLTYEKKVALTQVVGYNIILFFDMKCYTEKMLSEIDSIPEVIED